MKSRSTRFQSFESLEDKRIFLDIYKLLRNTRTTPLGGSIMPQVFRNFSVSFNYMRWKLTTPQTQRRPALMPWSSWQDSTSHKRELRAVHCTHCTRCTHLSHQGIESSFLISAGRWNFTDVVPGYPKGLSYVGYICEM